MLVVKCKHAELVALDKIKPNPKNPNKHSEAQIKRLSEILKYQGWRSPIVVSKRSGLVVVGHGRLEAAGYLGEKTAPVDYQDFESPEMEFAHVVADNSIASWADLDLGVINKELPDLGPDFDIDMLGLEGFNLDATPVEDLDQTEKPDTTQIMLTFPSDIRAGVVAYLDACPLAGVGRKIIGDNTPPN